MNDDASPEKVPSTQDFIPAEGPGTRIGPYKLLQQIGEGGMGVVYMAEQEQPVRRRVALKVIKPGMDSAHVINRFRAEQQALALMDHQNIAKVYDAGTTANGRPYFVMELVHGVPITKYCDDAKLTPRERLELFVPVCRAVQHAHQKGIIHRDLKPSNVLVCLYDGKPVAKVIDFGVAKAMEQPLTEATMYTHFGQVIGTLEYMSPEQAEMSQLGVDTRSDIYSLGVMMYELLTGSTPLQKHRIKQAARDEVLKRIREEDPPLPSSRLSSSTETLPTISQQRRMEPAQLTKLVRGELDWIVMKSLEKDRTRRYDTADGLARDIERFLSDEPVEACPPSTTYRLRKYAHKHRALLTTIAAFALILIAGTSVSVWQAIRATSAEAIAKKALDDAETDRDEALWAKAEAQVAEAHLRIASDTMRRVLYASDMNLVQVAAAADHPRRMFDLLERHRPKKDEIDLRGFEWHYWMRQLRSEKSLVSLEAFGPAADSSDPRDLVGPPVLSPSTRRCASAWPSANFDAVHVRVWDTTTGKLIAQSLIRSPDAPWRNLDVLNLAFSPDESRAHVRCVRSGPGGPVIDHLLLDTTTGKLQFCVADQELFFHPDGKRLLVTSDVRDNHFVVFWLDAKTGKEISHYKADGMVLFKVSNDAERFASLYRGKADDFHEVRVCETATGKVIAKIPLAESQGSGTSLQFSHDGKQLLIGPMAYTKTRFPGQTTDKPNVLTVWDVDTAKLLWTRSFSLIGIGVVASPNGKHYVSIDHGPAIRVDAATGQNEVPLPGCNSNDLALSYHLSTARSPISADGSMLLTWKAHGGFTIHSMASGSLVFEARFPADEVRAGFTPDNTAAVAIDTEGRVRHFDTRDLLKPRLLPGTSEPDTSAADIEADGVTILAIESVLEKGERKGALRTYDARTGRLERTLGTYPGIRVFPAHHLSRQLFFAVRQKDTLAQVIFVDLDTGHEQVVWKRTDDRFNNYPRASLLGRDRAILQFPAEFNPFADKNARGFAFWGSRLQVVDLKTGAEAPSWINELTDVELCVPSHDGKKIAILRHAGGKQSPGARELRLADAATGRTLATIPDIGFNAVDALFSPYSSQLLISGQGPGNAVAHLVDVDLGKLTHRLQSAGTRLISDFSFSPNGTRIIGLDGESRIYRLWDADTGLELGAFSARTTHRPFRFDKDGHRLIGLRIDWRQRPPGHALEVLDGTPLPGEVKRP